MKTEELFRMAGAKEPVDDLIAMCDAAQYDQCHADDPYVLADVLKSWLRSLSSPIIPSEISEECLRFAKERSTSSEELNHILSKLPKSNFNLLSALVHFVRELTDKSNAILNKLDISTLALMLSPGLLRPLVSNSDSLKLQVNFTRAVFEKFDPPPVNAADLTFMNALLESYIQTSKITAFPPPEEHEEVGDDSRQMKEASDSFMHAMAVPKDDTYRHQRRLGPLKVGASCAVSSRMTTEKTDLKPITESQDVISEIHDADGETQRITASDHPDLTESKLFKPVSSRPRTARVRIDLKGRGSLPVKGVLGPLSRQAESKAHGSSVLKKSSTSSTKAPDKPEVPLSQDYSDEVSLSFISAVSSDSSESEAKIAKPHLKLVHHRKAKGFSLVSGSVSTQEAPSSETTIASFIPSVPDFDVSKYGLLSGSEPSDSSDIKSPIVSLAARVPTARVRVDLKKHLVPRPSDQAFSDDRKSIPVAVPFIRPGVPRGFTLDVCSTSPETTPPSSSDHTEPPILVASAPAASSSCFPPPLPAEVSFARSPTAPRWAKGVSDSVPPPLPPEVSFARSPAAPRWAKGASDSVLPPLSSEASSVRSPTPPFLAQAQEGSDTILPPFPAEVSSVRSLGPLRRVIETSDISTGRFIATPLPRRLSETSSAAPPALPPELSARSLPCPPPRSTVEYGHFPPVPNPSGTSISPPSASPTHIPDPFPPRLSSGVSAPPPPPLHSGKETPELSDLEPPRRPVQRVKAEPFSLIPESRRRS